MPFLENQSDLRRGIAKFAETESTMYKGNRKYTNGEITVYWKPDKCVHATTCYRELINVFNPRKRPWVNMQGASTGEIIRVVRLCPTDALTFKYNSEISEEEKASAKQPGNPADTSAEPVSEVRVMKDGPLVFKGKFNFVDADSCETEKKGVFSVCRCGASNSMPFCDGMHRKTGYESR
jgi:uncharacterized Fe-S cluster protein YjdI